MADFSEKWGTDVDTAVQLALADLKLTIDEVEAFSGLVLSSRWLE